MIYCMFSGKQRSGMIYELMSSSNMSYKLIISLTVFLAAMRACGF